MKRGSHHSKESMGKISESLKGKQFSEERKKRISESLKGKSKCFTKEHKENISISRKGKHHSKETIKKISESHKKENLSEINRWKLSESKKGENNPRFGKSQSEETRKKISESKKGKPCSKEAKQKISEALKGKYCGEKASNWKDGISFEPYCQLFNKEFKEEIRDKFNRECFICGLSEELNGRKLPIHHINYNKNCLCDDSECYFVPLCNSCHPKTNFNREFWEKLLAACCEDQYMAEYFTESSEDIFSDLKSH